MRKFIIPLLILAICGAATVALIKHQPPAAKIKTEPVPIVVEALRATRESLSFEIESSGTVEPRTRTRLVAEVNGQVLSVSPAFVAGGFFKRAEPLVKIDPVPYEVEVARAQANLTAAKLRHAEEQARAEQAQKDWRLAGRSTAANAFALREPHIRDARAQISSAEAELQLAQRNLEKTTVTAPYDGFIRATRVGVGEFVSNGTELATSFSVEHSEVRLPLTTAELAFLELDASLGALAHDAAPEVSLSIETAGNTQRWEAKLHRVEAAVDEHSRMVYAVARIEDPYAIRPGATHAPLRTGVFVSARIRSTQSHPVIKIPRFALYKDRFVLVIKPDNRLEIRAVELLRSDRKFAYIRDGLEPAEHVSLTAIDFPTDGMRVQLAKHSNP